MIRVVDCHTGFWPRGYKTFLCSTQLSTKFILLIYVKMSTIVGILTFISMMNATSERLKARNFFICLYFSVYEQLKVRAQLRSMKKKFYNLGARVQTLADPKDFPLELLHWWQRYSVVPESASGHGSRLYTVVVDARLSGNKRGKSVVTVLFLTASLLG